MKKALLLLLAIQFFLLPASAQTYRTYTSEALLPSFDFGEERVLRKLNFEPTSNGTVPASQLDSSTIPRCIVITPDHNDFRSYHLFSWEEMDIHFLVPGNTNASFSTDRRGNEHIMGITPIEKVYVYITRKSNTSKSSISLQKKVKNMNSGTPTRSLEISLDEKKAWKLYVPEKLLSPTLSMGYGIYFLLDTGSYLYQVKFTTNFTPDILKFLNSLQIEGKQLHFEYDAENILQQVMVN